MKKNFTLLTFLLFVGISLLSYAQTFQLTDLLSNPYTHEEIISKTISEVDLDIITGDYVTDIEIVNLTDLELNIQTIRTNIVMAEGMSAYVCAGILCQPDDVFNIDFPIESNASVIYSLHLRVKDIINGSLHYGLCKFQLDFMAEGEKMTLFVEIDMPKLGVNDHNYANWSLVYPNPVSANSFINVAYLISDNTENLNLIIRNIMGAEVLNMPLDPCNSKAAVDISTLTVGTYFYAIENKNQILITKKLIVK